jgi:hypothetical protein
MITRICVFILSLNAVSVYLKLISENLGKSFMSKFKIVISVKEGIDKK